MTHPPLKLNRPEPSLKLNRPPRPKLGHGTKGSSKGLDALDEEERRERCLTLLEDLGVERIQTDERTGWLNFSCCLPDGEHRKGDRNPSAGINWRTLMFHCFSCGKYRIIPFITACMGWAPRKAMEYMLEGVSPNSTGYVTLVRYEPQSHHDISELEPFYVRRHSYLRERGIPEANLVKHEVGYDPQTTRVVFPVFGMNEKKDELGNVEYERELLGWHTRRTKDDGSPKYLPSEGLKTGQVVYNEERFRDPNVSRHLSIVVVESPLSVIAKSHLEDVGYGFVATFGGPKRGHYRTLAQYPDLILWFDADKARQYTELAWKNLIDKTNISVVNTDRTEDVDELPDDVVLELLEESIPYEEWVQIHA